MNTSTKTRHVSSENNHDIARTDCDKKNDRFPKTKTSNIVPQVRKDNAAGDEDIECETPSSRNVKFQINKAGRHHSKPDPNTTIPSNAISEPDNDPTDDDEAKDEVEEMKNRGAVIISCQRRLSDGLMSPLKKNKNTNYAGENHHYPPSSPTKSSYYSPYIQIKHHLNCGHHEQFQAQQKMLQHHQYQGGH